ncbi:hypothetical protein F0L74_23910 [Chitinophaga agrisoli]|uniref:Lipoprotein n=1 Tax=Chitinophaga agrisoli TaxID=2607653 RepID=A0A5B2VL64_9BACT|nr:hypothetical protein [Chitinophaga agrisoli]KAA2239256.1 hypothetical protein F0L74_23910 [Chitinophaga agrisoli]
MTKYQAIVFLLFPLIISCNSSDQPSAGISRDFHLPVVIQSPTTDTIEYKKMDCINEETFIFGGKHKFTDTLSLGERFLLDDTIPKVDIIKERSHPSPSDTLSTDGFQIFIDYARSVHYKNEYHPYGLYYFPIYVVNETSSTKVFYGKDNYAFGIQEAIYREDWSWRPIEGKSFDFCGNGHFGLKVHPGEFVLLLALKYQGEDKNMMRVRLEIGESLYISRSYEGTFSSNQFKLSPRFLRYLKDPGTGLSPWHFCGSVPVELDKN